MRVRETSITIGEGYICTHVLCTKSFFHKLLPFSKSDLCAPLMLSVDCLKVTCSFPDLLASPAKNWSLLNGYRIEESYTALAWAHSVLCCEGGVMPNATYPNVKRLVTPWAIATSAASRAVATCSLRFGRKRKKGRPLKKFDFFFFFDPIWAWRLTLTTIGSTWVSTTKAVPFHGAVAGLLSTIVSKVIVTSTPSVSWSQRCVCEILIQDFKGSNLLN